jgi:alpha-beta hydrolase superfamily lysophospholipase
MCGFPFTINGFKCLFGLLWRLTDERELLKIPATLPVFFVAGAEDPVGEYGEAVKKVKESFVKAGIKDVSLKLYEGDRHEILNEDDRQTVYEDIRDWLNAHIEKTEA